MNALIIVDGLAINGGEGDASVGMTPKMDELRKSYASCSLGASGLDVGLVDGVCGNSETGHLHIGAGRLVRQPLAKINHLISEGELVIPGLSELNGKPLHLMGLFSDGNVHACIDHFFAVLRLAKEAGVSEVFVHVFADGRDVGERTLGKYVEDFERVAGEVGIGKVASVCGRYYAMDRDNNLDRTGDAYDLITGGGNFEVYGSVADGLNALSEGVDSDYYLPGFRVEGGESASGDDMVLFMNYRTDRARQLTQMFVDKKSDVSLVCMARYEEGYEFPVVCEQEDVKECLGEVLSKNGIKQWRVAETEKFAHVTFFLNALRDEPFDGEIRIGLDSPKCASYKEKPEMSAYEVCDEVCKLVSEESEGVVIVNFANCDLVGHSGDFEATAKACAVVDECVAKIVDAVMFSGGVGLITADHGNADEMYYENGDVKPGHSEGLVSCTMFGKGLEGVDAVDGTLIDVAPTFLGMIGVGVPECMTGKDLLVPGS